jgi:pimeloyl-ACP methyl ester carboxylesterase
MAPNLSHSLMSSFISADQFLIHCVHKGTGPPMILLHGGGTWLYSFRHNFDALSRHFSVYAIDLPGHGYTKPLIQCAYYNEETICHTLAAFMDRVGISTTHFVGHSWGGAWAAYFSNIYPERVSKLVLIDSSGLNLREHLVWEFMKIPFIGETLFKFINTRAILKGLRESFNDKKLVTPEMVNSILDPLNIIENRKAQLSYSRKTNWKKIKNTFADVNCPALIIWGKHDRYINVRYGKQMAELINNSKFIVLEDCGHSPHEERPDVVNRLMIEFFK